MEKIRHVHSGRFTLKGYGQAAPEGKFIATFVVTEHQGNAELEIKSSTGNVYGTDHEAAEAGLEAATVWLEKHRPVNG
ncbi:hypothetical protein [Variovorax ginsengisoli]|uniref:Uncharacterized protein n=1 Tax=Variovorax ginsengisoli TaxID=363844 RepID=A0ABT8SDJ8_9BURK|nr:hypothetical protein [Variovorax ginsengisoli]MDN8617813.1 hypothetical protein [Variovorax ginsengisoli]MDO1536983.1 hypothetical protein [Variovorax ginsengisoli]